MVFVSMDKRQVFIKFFCARVEFSIRDDEEIKATNRLINTTHDFEFVY